MQNANRNKSLKHYNQLFCLFYTFYLCIILAYYLPFGSTMFSVLGLFIHHLFWHIIILKPSVVHIFPQPNKTYCSISLLSISSIFPAVVAASMWSNLGSSTRESISNLILLKSSCLVKTSRMC